MENKIKNIQGFQEFVKAFKLLLKNNNRNLFKCDNKEFQTKYSELYLNLKKYYKFVTGVKLQSSCSSDWIDKFYKIRDLTLINLIDMSNIDHKIKKDSRVYNIDGKFISWETKNLTNEICEKLYKKDPSAFEFYDKDWKGKEQLTVEAFTAATTKDTLKEFFKPEFTPVVEDKTIVESFKDIASASTEMIEEIVEEPKEEPKQEIVKETPKPKQKRKPAKRKPRTKKTK